MQSSLSAAHACARLLSMVETYSCKFSQLLFKLLLVTGHFQLKITFEVGQGYAGRWSPWQLQLQSSRGRLRTQS